MRHGKTDWNAEYKLQGGTDIPLNEEGREMARNAKKEYADVHFDICFCSPLVRAKETAEIFLEDRDIPIITDDRIREMSFGVYEGAKRVIDIPDCPMKLFFTDPENYVAVEGGESIEELFKRTGEFLKDMVYPLTEQGKDVLIVGHGAMNSSIICQVHNKPVSKFWEAGIPNCKLMKLL